MKEKNKREGNMEDSQKIEKHRRNLYLSNFIDLLECLKADEHFETKKSEIIGHYKQVIRSILSTDKDNKVFTEPQETLEKRKILYPFGLMIIGIIFGMTPIFMFLIENNTSIEIHYIPNAIAYQKSVNRQMKKKQDAIPLQIIYTPTEVDAAKYMQGLANKDFLEVGGAIRCSELNCFALSKTMLKTQYDKVVSITAILN